MLRKILVFVFMFAFVVASAQAAIIIVEDLPGINTEIQDAIDAANPGDTIMVMPGEYKGAEVDKAVELSGSGPETLINEGTPYGSFLIGFWLNADGATIKNFKIEGLFAGIISDQVKSTIQHNEIYNATYGIYLRGGSRCTVSHNIIRDSLMPLLVQTRIVSEYCLLAFNEITGDNSDFGIRLRTDSNIPFYCGDLNNFKVVHNKVSVKNGAGIQLFDNNVGTDMGVRYNYIGFNDFRGSDIEIVVSPSSVEEINTFSRNLGDNPGYENRGITVDPPEELDGFIPVLDN